MFDICLSYFVIFGQKNLYLRPGRGGRDGAAGTGRPGRGASSTSFTGDHTHIPNRSEGFPNGIFHPCALWDGGVARWESCRRVAAVAGVIWNSRFKINLF